MDEILKIILRCNKERMLLKPRDVVRICHIILKLKGYDFVKNVKVFSTNLSDSNCAGVYYNENIFFFYDGLIDYIEKCCDSFTDHYQIEGSDIDILNYYYLCTIFHELAHVRQHYIKNSKYNSDEKKIFSLFYGLSHNRDFYKENYSNFLTEVNADNVSVMTVNYLYSKLPKNFVTTNDRKCYESAMLNTILYSNYEVIPNKEIVLGPSEKIINNLNNDLLNNVNTNISKYVQLIQKNKLTLYKRLMLGLPISYQEYAYINLLHDEIKVGEDINALTKIKRIRK